MLPTGHLRAKARRGEGAVKVRSGQTAGWELRDGAGTGRRKPKDRVVGFIGGWVVGRVWIGWAPIAGGVVGRKTTPPS